MARTYARTRASGRGDAQTGSIYAQAFGRNTEFYTYYKSLEAYRAAFGKTGDVLVVDPTSEFFQFSRIQAKGRGGRSAPAN